MKYSRCTELLFLETPEEQPSYDGMIGYMVLDSVAGDLFLFEQNGVVYKTWMRGGCDFREKGAVHKVVYEQGMLKAHT